MTVSSWMTTFPAEIIVCDREGTILEMNETAIKLYKIAGGAALIGRSLTITTENPPAAKSNDHKPTRNHLVHHHQRRFEKAGLHCALVPGRGLCRFFANGVRPAGLSCQILLMNCVVKGQFIASFE